MEAHAHHGADDDQGHDHDHDHHSHDTQLDDPLETSSERMGKDPHIWLTPQPHDPAQDRGRRTLRTSNPNGGATMSGTLRRRSSGSNSSTPRSARS